MSEHFYTPLDRITLAPTATARDAITSLNLSSRGIVLVMEKERRLLGTITDGDIRRVLLEKLSLEVTLEQILAGKSRHSKKPPVTAAKRSGINEWLRVMKENSVQQLPLLDAEGRVLDLVTLLDLEAAPKLESVRAIIMAGGMGTRLMPLTENMPKPMLPIGDKPMLEHIISQLKDAGIRQVHLATHHLSEQIKEHFQEGQEHEMRIDYLREPVPLGTAGSLRLIDQPKETMLVMNGDILTTLDYRAMLAYHQKNQADLTVAVRHFEMQVPYGVVEVKDASITALIEKPTYTFAVNAGIYCLEPGVCELIPLNCRFDMTQLVEALIAKGRRVVSFPIHEYWIDVGQPDDYAQAQRDFTDGKFPITS